MAWFLEIGALFHRTWHYRLKDCRCFAGFIEVEGTGSVDRVMVLSCFRATPVSNEPGTIDLGSNASQEQHCSCASFLYHHFAM